MNDRGILEVSRTKCRNLRTVALLLAFTAAGAQEASAASCGELVTLQSHAQYTIRIAYTPSAATRPTPATLILLVGGNGYVNLSDEACPRALKGNLLIRMLPQFQAAGFATAVVDASSDYTSDDGLAGFRTDPRHADDIGKVITEVRRRAPGAVWLVGTSRGTISAVNAAARLSGPAAADGLVLTSILSQGDNNARKSWVGQSVFSLPLKDIRMPVLLVGHAADSCERSPPALMERVAAALSAARTQVVTITGGPFQAGQRQGALACEGRSAHGFLQQEAEVLQAISHFIDAQTP